MNRREFLTVSTTAVAVGALLNPSALVRAAENQTGLKNARISYFAARPGSRSRDVAFAPDGAVWYCGQRDGTLTRLDPENGSLHAVSLGEGAAPHGVVLGPDNAFWVTEGGQNAIARLDPATDNVDLIPLPTEFSRANLNTGTFDLQGIYWFTGQNGVYGRVDPKTSAIEVWASPGGRGPYGITVTPSGEVWYASLAGSHIAQIDRVSGSARMVQPPTPKQGARRIWADSRSRLWVSEWNSGQVSVFDPETSDWKTWKLPGDAPRAYSVYVDEHDGIWLTDFGANAIVHFDPDTEIFTSFPSDMPNANVRQMAGRPGEAWGGESGTDRLVRIQFDPA
ncbi:MAG: lyase [Stappiaceae bacterium]